MDRRSITKTVAATIAAASERAGATASSIAEATGIPADDVRSKLSGAEEFTVNELGMLGGLFRVPAADLIGAVA